MDSLYDQWPTRVTASPYHAWLTANPYHVWPALNSFGPTFPSISRRSSLEKMLRGVEIGARWVDKGEHVDAFVPLPRGFRVDESGSLSAELDTSADMHKVTVHGSRAGLRFSRSLSLPFPVSEADIELEHHPRAGLLALRLRKPADADTKAQPLSIKRVEEEPEAEKVELHQESAKIAAAQPAAEEQHAAPASAEEATRPPAEQRVEEGQMEEELDKKFAFVKQAEVAGEASRVAAEAE